MRLRLAILVAITALAVARVAVTHREMSGTLDEPAHLADGYEWFEGRYALDPAHPPLARVLGALPLRLAGIPEAPRGNATERGSAILYNGDYWANLRRARTGNLLLLVVAITGTYFWARRTLSPAIALTATAILTSLPPLLGHAGLLTTDLAVTAMLPIALIALERFLDRPSLARAVALGAAIGLGLLAKFSFLVYFPAAALVVLIVRRSTVRATLRLSPVVLLAAFLVVWAGYRFTFGKPSDLSRDAVFLFHYAAPEPLIGPARVLAQTRIPAPAFALGIASLKFHDREGHEAYLLGELRKDGWWHYFPVVFFFKTPLPFLIFIVWGLRSRHAAIAAAILLVAITGSINIGVRHILPMYVPLAIAAAHGVAEIARRAAAPFSRTALTSLLVWLFAGSVVAHPHYVAWFNELAQPNPARIAVDSNLDWGQDAARLDRTAQAMGIDTLHVAMATTIPFATPTVPLQPYVRTSGWVAVSETPVALAADEYRWLNHYRPVTRVGSSIRLYHVP